MHSTRLVLPVETQDSFFLSFSGTVAYILWSWLVFFAVMREPGNGIFNNLCVCVWCVCVCGGGGADAVSLEFKVL